VKAATSFLVGSSCTAVRAAGSGSTALRCRSWGPSLRPSRCMSRPTARRYGAWGRRSGSCGFRRGEIYRFLTSVALAIAGAFVGGGSGKERTCRVSQE
jgi:hypothetical protein